MVRFTLRQIAELYRRGFALFLVAPLIVAIQVVPEFLQHIVEIRIGMFDSIDQARALADDPRRWAFGYAKLAGLLIAIFASARYWATAERGGKWWRVGDIAWVPLVIALLLFAVVPLPLDLLKGRAPDWLYWTVYTVLSIAVLPLLFPILAALFGDQRQGVLSGYWRDWRWLPLFMLLLVVAYAPAMAAHLGLHRLALGAATPLLWALMAVDSLVVGLLASLVGAAFSLAYRAARPPSA